MQSEVAVQLPHLEVMDRLWRLPMVESAWNTSAGMYGYVKNYHPVSNWTLSTAEGAVQMAVHTIAPVAKKFESPIHAVDEKLCKGLDILEKKVPLVKESPQQVGEKIKEFQNTAKGYVNATLQPALQTVEVARKMNVSSLKDLSWTKANEILGSRYGQKALSGLDSTTSIAEQYLDYYLPSEDSNEENERVHPSNECEDKVLHTVHTVGRLSNKVGRRVYRTLSRRISQINKDNINEYLNSLAAVVSLTTYLNEINKNVESNVANDTTTPTTTNSSSAENSTHALSETTQDSAASPQPSENTEISVTDSKPSGSQKKQSLAKSRKH